MKKLLPLFLVVIVLVLIVILLRSGQKGNSMQPTEMEELETEVKISAEELATAFYRDEVGANEAYLNKIVTVTGVVAQLSANGLVLSTRTGLPAIRCRMDKKPDEENETFQVGESVQLKCVCSGLVQEVEMVQCVEQ